MTFKEERWSIIFIIFITFPIQIAPLHGPPELISQFEKQVRTVLDLQKGDPILVEQMKALSGTIMDMFKVCQLLKKCIFQNN